MDKYEKVVKFIKEGNGIYFTKEFKENGIDKYYINNSSSLSFEIKTNRYCQIGVGMLYCNRLSIL